MTAGKKGWIGAALCALLLTCAGTAFAGSFEDLQARIDGTAAGGTLTLTEDYAYDAANDNDDATGIVIDKAIVIDGANFKISGETAARVLKIESGAAQPVVVKNLTVTKGGNQASGPGVHVGFEANVAFENCVFTDNGTISGGHTVDGGSIYVESKAVVSFTDCKITGNRGADRAAGVYLKGNGTFTRCEVTNNVGGSRGGGIYVDPGNNKAGDPAAFGRGGEFGGNLKIYDSTITGNTGGRGAGLYINSENRTPNIIQNCVVESNDVSANNVGNGGGVLFYNAVGLVDGCAITGNAAKYGGGLIVDVLSSVSVLRTEISGNHATVDGGGLYCHDGSHVSDPMKDVGIVFLSDSKIVGNTSGTDPDAVDDDINIHWSENDDKTVAGWVARYDGYIVSAGGNTIGTVAAAGNFFAAASDVIGDDGGKGGNEPHGSSGSSSNCSAGFGFAALALCAGLALAKKK